MQDFDVLAFTKCCADDTRLKCLLLLTHYNKLCVCDLTEALDLSQPKVSRHLAELRKAELLIDERRGKWVYYSLNPALPAWVNKVLTEMAEANTDYLHRSLLWLADLTKQGRDYC